MTPEEEQLLLQQLNDPSRGKDLKSLAARGWGLLEDTTAAIPTIVGTFSLSITELTD